MEELRSGLILISKIIMQKATLFETKVKLSWKLFKKLKKFPIPNSPSSIATISEMPEKIFVILNIHSPSLDPIALVSN